MSMVLMSEIEVWARTAERERNINRIERYAWQEQSWRRRSLWSVWVAAVRNCVGTSVLKIKARITGVEVVVFTAYLVATVLAAAANLFAAGSDFVRDQRVAANMARTGVPESWMIPLGLLKAGGALGLLVGIWVPPIGVAASVGLVLFFVGAIVVHLRSRFHAFAFPAGFLVLAVAALVLRLVTS